MPAHPSLLAPPPAEPAPPMAFLPAVQTEDLLARYWLRQVTLRLRREICWLWHERGDPPANGGRLPPFRDKLTTVLDLARYAQQKAAFFAEDDTAGYLSTCLAEPPPAGAPPPPRGSFSWIVDRLALTEVDAFLLALALAPVVDPAAGTVCAAVVNDPARTFPSLTLAQRLWDQPNELLALADPAHPLWCGGLLTRPVTTEPATLEWDAPLTVPPLLAGPLLFPSAPPPTVLRPLNADADVPPPPGADLALARLLTATAAGPRLQPLLGPPGAALADAASAFARAGGRVLLTPAPGSAVSPATLCTLAWLCGVDLFIEYPPPRDSLDDRFPALPALPVTLFLGLRDRAALRRLPPAGVLPALVVPPLTYHERRALWQRTLGSALPAGLAADVDECARRFRSERTDIIAAARGLVALRRPITADDLVAAGRSQLTIEINDLAQRVTPRFAEADLMLPAKPTQQIREIVMAMQALTEVHYAWGAARPWNECGLSALFAGPPGTGKTMAAEVIAARLDLPLYRIDLSQVVNKYIGETEKNLQRLFDAADASDVVLFFDEADALFGKRTEVKDAHDRYANLEVSYLLERMERFKGLAILATNRKKDLDEAFLRRLRFVVNFPLPGGEERLRIWQRILPPDVDCSQLDLPFLAQRLPLAGGHLRSIVFNACLQSARPGAPRALTMAALLAAAKREYDKLERPLNREQLGPYAGTVSSADLAP